MAAKKNPLTNDQRLLLGVAIAMAQADHLLDAREEALIELLYEQLRPSPKDRTEIAKMVKHPPSAEEIARWAVTELDRVGVYATALQMAQIDGRVFNEEAELLERLAGLLRLSPTQIKAAAAFAQEALAREVRP